jgi:hypothetical protein
MNTNPPDRGAPDELDRLLSDFFKARLKHPWPDAPRPSAGFGAALATIGPSELATVRTASAPRNRPAAAGRDGIARSRFTLAASVALMLGTCWYLSDGAAPGPRPAPGPTSSGPALLSGATADGDSHQPLKVIRKDKATGDLGPAIDMDDLK